MKILSEKENIDKSTTFEMSFDDEEVQILIEYAVQKLLREYIERESKNVKKRKSKK